jgi:hypothetical protein
MGRRGLVSSLGAAGALAAAGTLALLLVSLYVTFTGWPGMRQNDLPTRSVELAGPAEPQSTARRVRLAPSAASTSRRRSRAAGERRSGRSRAPVRPGRRRAPAVRLPAPPAAGPLAPPTQNPVTPPAGVPSPVPSAPGVPPPDPSPVNEAVEDVKGLVDDIIDPDGPVAPVTDQVVTLLDDATQGLDGATAPVRGLIGR